MTEISLQYDDERAKKNKLAAPKRLAVLLYPGMEPMDYQGPCGIFDLWHMEEEGPEVIWVAENRGPIECAYGRNHIAQYAVEDLIEFDALLVPGGKGRRQACQNRNLVEFIRTRGGACQHLLSVCTGSFLLAAAGLLDGLRVTTHYEFTEELSQDQRFEVVKNQPFVRDGRVWTAGGIYLGIDLALAFIQSFEGTLRPDGKVRTDEARRIKMISQYNCV